MNVKQQKLIDGSAMGLSLLCLFHCLAMPFVVSVLPMLGAHLFEETAIHAFFFLAALPLSFFGLWLGVKGAHGGARLMIIAGFGLILMLAGALHDISGDYDVALTSVGVSFVALAHFLNWRRHERAHHHLPHDHLLHHGHQPCPCEDDGAALSAAQGNDRRERAAEENQPEKLTQAESFELSEEAPAAQVNQN